MQQTQNKVFLMQVCTKQRCLWAMA